MKRWYGLILAVLTTFVSVLPSFASQGIYKMPSASREFRRSGQWFAYQLVNPANEGTTDIHSGFTSGTDSTLTKFFTSTESNLLHSAAHRYGRSLVVTTGGTTGDIKAGIVTIYGKNCLGEEITQTYTITDDLNGSVVGTKAFWSVRKMTIPAQDGTGGTYSVGFGALIGLPFTSPINSVFGAWSAGTRETTAPTVTFDKTDVELNTLNPNTAFNGANDWVILGWIPPFGSITAEGVWY